MIPNNKKKIKRQRRKDEHLFSYLGNVWSIECEGTWRIENAKNSEKIRNQESNRTVSSLNEKKKVYIDRGRWEDVGRCLCNLTLRIRGHLMTIARGHLLTWKIQCDKTKLKESRKYLKYLYLWSLAMRVVKWNMKQRKILCQLPLNILN